MDADRRVAAWFVRQEGLVTRTQALEAGCTRHQIQNRLDRGLWVAAEQGVYRHQTHPATWSNRLLAVCLGAGAVASHRSAAALWGLDGCRPVRLEVTVPPGRWVRRRGVTVHETTQWDRTAPTVRRGVPVTGIERTLVDLAAVVGPARLRQAVDDAHRQRLTDLDRLDRTLAVHARRGRNGTSALRVTLASYTDDGVVPRSDWSNAVADLLMAAGLPRPALEHPVSDGNGFRAELDLAYPDARVGIELDSLAWHFNHESFHRDPVRRNRLATLGWRVLSFTWAEFVDHPDRLVATTRGVLRTSR